MSGMLLPPPYRAMRLTGARSAVAAGREAAAAGIAEGALFWCERADRLDCGLVLRPDRRRRETLPVIYVGALAVADALAIFAAPAKPIAFRWPGGIVIDGGLAGRVSLDCAPGGADAVPAWTVLGFALTLTTAGREAGLAPEITSLAEEGFADFTAAGLIEGFSRHFLRWLDRWEAEGFAPIAAAWWARAVDRAAAPPIAPPGERRGAPCGLSPAGDLRVRRGGRDRLLRLETALGGGLGDA
jgi:BirA family transcriptional regulator, biotin operon repressor / biotin---[acetyl-CoA-carboxylase] ligase